MAPLTDRIPHALLPLAGKSILRHALQSLYRGSIREVDVVAPELHDEIEAGLDTSSLRGMRVRFVTECPDLQQSDSLSLVIGLSNLFDVDWDELIASLGVVRVHFLIPSMLRIGSTNVALVTPAFFSEDLSSDWNEIDKIEAVPIELSGFNSCRVPTDSFVDYHNANFQLLRDNFENLKSSGRKRASGYLMGRKSKLHRDSLQSEHAYVGSHCRIEKSAWFSGDVVIGDNVVVASGTNVANSIICDHTYIGENLDCRNSIVNGNLLIRVDTGTCVEVDDPELLDVIA
jgi:NDP-sugar pyrophosphorylase family protein